METQRLECDTVTEEKLPESIYEGDYIIDALEPTFDFYDGLDEKLDKIHEAEDKN